MTLNLHPLSALSCLHGIQDFWCVSAFSVCKPSVCVSVYLCLCVCISACVYCSNRTKDPFVQQARGFNVSSTNTLCAACIFMYVHVCCPHVCICSLIVYQKRLKLEFSVFVSLWSAAFAPGWADFRPPAFCQTPLAFLSSGYNPPDFCCSEC